MDVGLNKRSVFCDVSVKAFKGSPHFEMPASTAQAFGPILRCLVRWGLRGGGGGTLRSCMAFLVDSSSSRLAASFSSASAVRLRSAATASSSDCEHTKGKYRREEKMAYRVVGVCREMEMGVSGLSVAWPASRIPIELRRDPSYPLPPSMHPRASRLV